LFIVPLTLCLKLLDLLLGLHKLGIKFADLAFELHNVVLKLFTLAAWIFSSLGKVEVPKGDQNPLGVFKGTDLRLVLIKIVLVLPELLQLRCHFLGQNILDLCKLKVLLLYVILSLLTLLLV